MYSKIVVGYDNRPQSHDALALASDLATRTDAEILAAFIYHREPVYESGDRNYRRQMREKTLATLGSIADHLPAGMRFETGAYPSRTASEGLRDVALGERRDLIAIGSAHRGPLGQLVLGAVGRDLCAAPPCAVTVAPRGYGEKRSRLAAVGVAFDGSSEAKNALHVAGTLAAAGGGVVNVVSVAEHKRLARIAPGRRAVDDVPEVVGQVLDQVDSQLQVNFASRSGNPTHELAEAAQEFDMLVVGSRGFGPLHRLFSGSVSASLASNPACPLLVVPGK